MKSKRKGAKPQRKPAEIKYCGDNAYVTFDDAEEWSILDGTPPPPMPDALRKELEQDFKEELARRKKRLLAIQRIARSNRRKASGRQA